MKKFLLVVSMLMVSASANAAFIFQGQAQVGPFINCTTANYTSFAYRVVSIQYNFSCMDVIGRVFGYNPVFAFNDLNSYVVPGQVKTFPGPTTMGCNVVAASCTVLAQ